MCAECVDLDQTTHSCAGLSPPPGYPTSQITVVAQYILAVPLLLVLGECCGDEPFAQLWGEKKNPKKLTSTFGITVTLVCQKYTNMRTERKWFTFVDMDCEYKQKAVSFFQLLFNSPILKPCVFSVNS